MFIFFPFILNMFPFIFPSLISFPSLCPPPSIFLISSPSLPIFYPHIPFFPLFSSIPSSSSHPSFFPPSFLVSFPFSLHSPLFLSLLLPPSHLPFNRDPRDAQSLLHFPAPFSAISSPLPIFLFLLLSSLPLAPSRPSPLLSCSQFPVYDLSDPPVT